MSKILDYDRQKPSTNWVILRNLGKKEMYWFEMDRYASFQLVLYKNEEKKEYMLALHDDDDYIVKFNFFGEVFDPTKYNLPYDAEFVQYLLDTEIAEVRYTECEGGMWVKNEINSLLSIHPMYQATRDFAKIMSAEDIVTMAKTLFKSLMWTYAPAQTKERKIEIIKDHSHALIFSQSCEFDETEITEIYDYLEPFWLEQQQEGNCKSWW